MSISNVRGVSIDVEEVEATIAGGLFGSLQGAVVLQLLHLDSLPRMGALIGWPTLMGGWVAYFALGMVFAIPFGAFVSGSINSFVTKVITLSRRSTILQKILVPLLERSALAVTTYSLGQGYGLVIGVVFHLLVFPLWLGLMGVSVSFPLLTFEGLVGVVGWLVYGSMLGLAWGLVMEA